MKCIEILGHCGAATPVDPYLNQKNDMNRWLNNARETISAYIDILEHWEKVYTPRSPIDSVSEMFLESVHQKGYAAAVLYELTYGSDKEKRELYKNAQDYVQRIKKRLDSIDTVSRKAPYQYPYCAEYSVQGQPHQGGLGNEKRCKVPPGKADRHLREVYRCHRP